MARIPRVVLPGIPHHITQRGNRRQKVFFSSQDYQYYLDLLIDSCRDAQTVCWAYCLMPNHVHLILVPDEVDGLRNTLAEAHRKYTRMINFRHGWRGHLWQERFHSFPMDEKHLYRATRYVEVNPVRAGLVSNVEDWPWSSARAHLCGENSGLVDVSPMLARVGDWSQYLRHRDTEAELDTFRKHSRTGRPLGDKSFVECAELATGRSLVPDRPGPRRVGVTEEVSGN